MKILWRTTLLILTLGIGSSWCNRTASAQTGAHSFAVHTTADAGEGSLRTAIAYANSHKAIRIRFEIPIRDAGYDSGTSSFVINLKSALPHLSAWGTVLDGATESLFLKSTTNSAKIVISGGGLPGNDAVLLLSAPECEVKSLIFRDCPGPALLLSGKKARGIRIVGSIFESNRGGGIEISDGARKNEIGLGPRSEESNEVVGNHFQDSGKADIRIEGDSSRSNTIRGNRFEGEAKPVQLPPSLQKEIPAPRIAAMNRLARTDSLWHEIVVIFSGRPKQKLTLDIGWDAGLVSENGRGTSRFRSKRVQTDAHGRGGWKFVVKGYPAGKMRAYITDDSGSTSEMSPVFDVPWLY